MGRPLDWDRRGDAELRRPKVTGSLRPSREGKQREGFKEWAWRGIGNCLGTLAVMLVWSCP